MALTVLLGLVPVSWADLPPLTAEVWGRTSYGDGYVYGPSYRASGVTVVDYDVDGDYDFVLPSFTGRPQVMRNLGSDRAFLPGGPKELNIDDPNADTYLSKFMDFADVTGDGLPDLVVVGNNTVTNKGSIYYYKNNGPRTAPVFAPTAQPVYTSPQTGTPIGPLDLVDLDGDGKVDLCFIEYAYDVPSDPPVLYFMKNTGASPNPWTTKTNLTPITNKLPPPDVVKSNSAPPTVWGGPVAKSDRSKTTTYMDVVTDMEFGDWDSDGDLDFLFYNSTFGVEWLVNVNPALPLTNANRWGSELNRTAEGDYVYPYTQWDGYDRTSGAFSVRPGPGLERYPDFYVSVEGMLITWRYHNVGGDYEIVQQNAAAFDADTGVPAFWDCDGDGDLDMFRTKFTDANCPLVLFRNVGTPYSPIWESETLLEGVTVDPGTSANQFRQDPYAFSDADGNGQTELYVQRQNGRVQCFGIVAGTATTPPRFFSYGNIVAGAPIIQLGDSEVQPRGIAMADFNGTNDGVQEMIVAYDSNYGGRLLYLAQNFANILLWAAPIELELRDGNGDIVEPYLIESLASTDFDRDGRPDLVVTISEWVNYRTCEYLFYRNVYYAQTNTFAFEYTGKLSEPDNAEWNWNRWARMVGFADIDTDGDDDLFMAHQYFDADEPRPDLSRYPYLHFYRNGSDPGIGFWQTRVVSGQSWNFTIDGVLPNYKFILNASGGGISQGVYTAGPTSKVVDIIESTNASPNYRIFIDVLPEVGIESKAIIVVGGSSTDPLYPGFQHLASQAYQSLRLQGIAKDNIRLFCGTNLDADGLGGSDTFAAPTLTGLQTAITQWARGSERLLVYLMDHGQRERFRINAVDYLAASTYDTWLDQVQAATPAMTVTTVIDTCESGSFIDDLRLTAKARKAGVKRITITSADVGPTRGIALFDAISDGHGGVASCLSFSAAFWEELRTGGSYGRAFDIAKVAIESINPLQVPQIDDNGNGIPNEPGDGRTTADTMRPGADFERPSQGVYIGEVAPEQAITSNTATLWLSDVVAGFPAEGAGAVIVPPNLERSIGSGDDEQPISGFVWVEFTYNANLKRWESNYNGFTTGGLYRIQYYVRVLGRYYASPRIGFVDRIGIADAWEDDDTFAKAPWLSLNFVQGHNFHKNGDADWARFTSPANTTCTIAVLAPGPNCQPVVKLYRASDLEANPNASPLTTVESPAPGKEVVFDWSFSVSDLFVLRVSNKTSTVFGAGTSYLLLVAAGTGGIIPPTVVVTVLESGSNAPIGAAAVKATGAGGPFNTKTTTNGQTQFVCSSDATYTVLAEKTGYKSTSRIVRVNNQIETVLLKLVPETTPTVTVSFNASSPGAKLVFDGAEYDLPQGSQTQQFVVATNSAHSVSVLTALPGGLTFEKWSDNQTQATRTLTIGTTSIALTAIYKGVGVGTDINHDGKTNAIDVQLVVNGALGLGGADTDVNGDGTTNAIDIQLVVNAVLAG